MTRPDAVAEPDRAHPGRLGRRARRPDPPSPRCGGLHAGRRWRRGRAVRRIDAPSPVPRRVVTSGHLAASRDRVARDDEACGQECNTELLWMLECLAMLGEEGQDALMAALLGEGEG